MKPITQKLCVFMAMLCTLISASAYDFEVDGIYYNILSLEELTCEVTYNDGNRLDKTLSFSVGYSVDKLNWSYPSYTGKITIPSTVNYKGKTLSVIGVGEYAFLGCTGLSSLSLPSSIKQIATILVGIGYPHGDHVYAGAFDYCNIETFSAGNAYILDMFERSYAFSSENRPYNNLRNLVLTNDFIGAISVDFSSYKKLVSIRSDAYSVPQFSDGPHFANEHYLNTEVLVPEDAFSSYQSDNVWGNFWELKAMKSVKSITLNETSLNLEPNQTIQLVPAILPEDAFDSSLIWTSSNPTVASVDANGIITSYTKGDAIISASSNDGSNITAQCAVHVDLLAKEIILSEKEIGLEPGESKTLKVTIKPDNAFVKDVIWLSDAKEIATIDQNGNIKANKIGVANITAQTVDGSNLTANCKVTVAELVKSISITPSESIVKEGETLQLTCLVAPETATYKDVLWTSDDNDIATVTSDGLVTAVSAGTTKVKARSTDGSNVFGECDFTVMAETIENNGICYQRNSPSTLKIVANIENPYNGDFIIPSKADFKGLEMRVTEIGVDAFAKCDELTGIVIPNTVIKINENAFKGCSNLKYVKLCDGSPVTANFDNLFSDSPIAELYIGSNGISYNSESRILNMVKGMTLGNTVTMFPPKDVFNSLEYFIVEDGDMTILEPEDYCSSSMSLINQQTIKDPNTYIYYRLFYLITYTHLSPILNALQKTTLNYLHIGREIQQVEVDTSKTQEKIPTTAGSRYQQFGYMDEVNYQYQDIIVKSDYNRNPIESISINKTIIELNVGESIKLSASYLPTNASFTVLAWSSSNENVAVIDSFGNVTKIAEGDAIITASTCDGSNLSATCKIVDIGAGIEDVILPSSSLVYKVYNLQGIKVLKTDDVQKIKRLPIGIYIVNGKKIAIR